MINQDNSKTVENIKALLGNFACVFSRSESWKKKSSESYSKTPLKSSRHTKQQSSMSENVFLFSESQ